MRLVEDDFTLLPESERESALLLKAQTEARTPFTVSALLPTLRANLLKLGPDRHALLLTFHHIVTDGWSLGVLGRDLAAFYNTRCAGTAPVLPSLMIQYADYAVWQRAWLHGDVLDDQLAYWRGQLAGAPASIDLPTRSSTAGRATIRGASIQFAVNRETREALFPGWPRVQRNFVMTLLAGFAVLYRYSGQSDIVVGSRIAGRTRAELPKGCSASSSTRWHCVSILQSGRGFRSSSHMSAHGARCIRAPGSAV